VRGRRASAVVAVLNEIGGARAALHLVEAAEYNAPARFVLVAPAGGSRGGGGGTMSRCSAGAAAAAASRRWSRCVHPRVIAPLQADTNPHGAVAGGCVPVAPAGV